MILLGAGRGLVLVRNKEKPSRGTRPISSVLAARRTSEEQLRTSFFILGLPGETKESIRNTNTTPAAGNDDEPISCWRHG